MTLNEENPVSSAEAAKILRVSTSTISALKRSIGITRHKVFVSELRKFLRSNPNWTTTMIYHSPKCRCNECLQKRAARKARQSQLTETASFAAPAIAKGNNSTFLAGEPPTVKGSKIGASPTSESSPSVQPEAVACRTVDRFRSALGAKLRHLRGKRSADKVAKDCNPSLTRESIFRIERGDSVKLCTVKTIATALGASKAEMLELIKEWAVQVCGEDSRFLRIEPIEAAMVNFVSQGDAQFSEIKPLLEQLSVEDRNVLIRVLGHRELIKRVLQLICVMTPMIGVEEPGVS